MTATRQAPRRAERLAGRPRTLGWAELRFRAMGTQVHLAVLGDDPTVLVEARLRIEELEARWSRFRADSLLSRLNRAAGHKVLVDDETFDLVTTAVAAWHHTGHRFDPTVHDAMVRSGYDRTFDQIGTGPGPARGPVPLPAPGCAAIGLDPVLLGITLPPGTHLDLGGIAKGRTADLVAAGLLAAGAPSALVNLGGDLRITGEVPAGSAFSIAIEDPSDLRRSATVVDLDGGGLATSSRARRRWTVGGVEHHHLIDPATGAPADTGLAAVTVIAADTTEAEVLAKATLVAGADDGPDLLTGAGAAGLLIGPDGSRRRVGDFEDHER